MTIAYDRQATFVTLPTDIAFDHIIRGEMPVTSMPQLQPECALWCKTNLRGHYGAQERENAPVLHKDGIIRTSYTYSMWFELLEDATHFKLRWF